MELASLNSDMALACEIKHDDKLTDEDGVYIQVWFSLVDPLSQIFFLIWLESGSIALHILFWAEETKNMQHVTERWIFFFFSSKYAV